MVKIGLFILLLLLGGCIVKPQIDSSVSYKIVIKTKDIAIADIGFLQKSRGYTGLEIFTAGRLVLHVELSDMACINNECTNRLDFNQKVFGYGYYKNLLDDILDGKPIYNGDSLKKTEDGFIQKISMKNYSIIYKVNGKNIYFKDRKNHVLIKLKRI